MLAAGRFVRSIAKRGMATEFLVGRDDGSEFAIMLRNDSMLQPGGRVRIRDFGYRTRSALRDGASGAQSVATESGWTGRTPTSVVLPVPPGGALPCAPFAARILRT